MTAALGLVALGVLVLHWASVAVVWRRIARARTGEGLLGRPRVTLIRPVCGLDTFDAETLASSFRQDYPEYEVIFCAQRTGDPAIAVVDRLIAAYPLVRARLMVGNDAVTRNPKLNNVWKGWHAATSDWICMADANLMLPRDYLATVVDTWDAGCGLVSSPPVGTRAEGWGGRLEAAFLNGNQARLQLAADSLGTGFAQGKTLFFNRRILARAGGLAALGRDMAEDVAATRITRALGLHVRLTPRPFAQPVGRKPLRAVLARQLRWSRVRRAGFPALFALEPLNGGALPVVLAALALAGAGQPLALAALFAAAWYVPEWALMARAGWPAGWRDAALLPVRDALIPALWLATLRRRGFDWRGTAMDLPESPEGAR